VAGLAMKKHIEQPTSEENLHFDLCFVATAVCLQKKTGHREGNVWTMFTACSSSVGTKHFFG